MRLQVGIPVQEVLDLWHNNVVVLPHFSKIYERQEIRNTRQIRRSCFCQDETNDSLPLAVRVKASKKSKRVTEYMIIFF